MSAIDKDQIVAALSRIVEPARQQDIVSLGMVSGIMIDDGHVGFAGVSANKCANMA